MCLLDSRFIFFYFRTRHLMALAFIRLKKKIKIWCRGRVRNKKNGCRSSVEKTHEN